MALGLKAWLGLIVAACGVVAIGGWLAPTDAEQLMAWYQRNRSESEKRYRELNNEASAARGRLQPAREYLLQLERRDSILALIDTRDFDDIVGAHLIFDNRLPRGVRNSTDSILSELSPSSHESIEPVPYVVAVLIDTVRSVDRPRAYTTSRSNLAYSLPIGDQEICVAAMGAQKRALIRWNNLWDGTRDTTEAPSSMLPATPPEMIGPCAYYAAFGQPGGTIASWLEDVGYAPALLPNWIRTPPYRGRLRGRRTRWNCSYQDYLDICACAAGEESQCLSAVTEPIPSRASDRGYAGRFYYGQSTYRPNGVVHGWRYWWQRTGRLGYSGESYLSDLLLDMSEERFARFWTSNAPIEDAFANAFDVSLEDWTMKWAREQVGSPRRGPTARASSALLGLLVAAAFLGAGVAYRNKREIS